MAKFSTCIPWLDELTEGGLPTDGITLICGGAGAGKTLLTCQIAASVARRSENPERTLFVAFEERAEEVLRHIEGFDWKIAEITASGLFSVLEARPSADLVFTGDFDLQGLLASVGAKARQTSARIIILDGLDEVLRWLPSDNRRAAEISRIRTWLDREALIGIITAKANVATGDLLDAFGDLQFAVSLVIALERRLSIGGTMRTLRVLKYRGSGHGTAAYPYFISSDGLEPVEWRPAPASQSGSQVRVSQGMTSGVARLDVLLGGAGYPRGGSVLISGAPGTGKSTLGSIFVDATCRAGLRALYVGFDAPPDALARDMTSVGLDLPAHVTSGALRMMGFHAAVLGPEQVLAQILAVVDEHRPDAMVIDPVSALVRDSGPADLGAAVVRRLVDEARARGIGILLTSLVTGAGMAAAMEPDTESGVSTIADFWIVLAYAERGGERNRTLSIVKARGRAHSNQTRELIMSGQGCTLADVYTLQGEVLLGTARLEREAADRAAARFALEEQRQRRDGLVHAVGEANLRLTSASEDLEMARGRLQAEDESIEEGLVRLAEQLRQVAASRNADVVENGNG